MYFFFQICNFLSQKKISNFSCKKTQDGTELFPHELTLNLEFSLSSFHRRAQVGEEYCKTPGTGNSAFGCERVIGQK